MTFIIKVKLSGSDNRARVLGGWGITASCTSSAEIAVRNAAEKLCKRLGRPYSDIRLKQVARVANAQTWLLQLPDVGGR